MNNLLSYCGLVDLRINASDKDLPVLLSYVVPVKSKLKISQNFVTFSEYMNFNINIALQILRMSRAKLALKNKYEGELFPTFLQQDLGNKGKGHRLDRLKTPISKVMAKLCLKKVLVTVML